MMMIVGLKKLIRRYDGDVVMMSFRHIDIRMCDMFKLGADLFWEFFFFRDLFLGVGGGFRAVQAPFWENPGVKCRFRAVFQDIWGGFKADQW